MEEELDAHTLWNAKACELAYTFAKTCDLLRSSRPVPEANELQEAIGSLVTELWDQNYSTTEIRKTFLDALESLPRYAAGYDSRSLECEARAAREKERGKS